MRTGSRSRANSQAKSTGLAMRAIKLRKFAGKAWKNPGAKPMELNDLMMQEAQASKEKAKRNLALAIVLVASVVLLAVFAYHSFEGWDWFTSVYFATSTITTVGYGDVTPKTEAGRVFTVFFIWFGVAIGFYALYSISRYASTRAEARFNKILARLQRKK